MVNHMFDTEPKPDDSHQEAVNITVATLSSVALVAVLAVGLYYWNRRQASRFRIPDEEAGQGEAPIPLQDLRPVSQETGHGNRDSFNSYMFPRLKNGVAN